MSTKIMRHIERARAGSQQDREEIEVRIREELMRNFDLRQSKPEKHTRSPVSSYINNLGQQFLERSSGWDSRIYFYSIAAGQLRNVLKNTNGVAGEGHAHSSVVIDANSEARAISFNQWDDLLTHLSDIDPLKARLAELYFFGGMSYEGMAKAVSRSVLDVDRQLRFAKAWLCLKLMKA